MTLALELSRQGSDVTLMEASGCFGGLAGTMRIGEYSWDRFYHVILLSDRHLTALLAELGLDTDIQWGVTKTGFFTDGRFHGMSNVVEFLKFPPLNLIDKLRLGATIFYASRIRSWKSLESISAVAWLTRLSGKRTAEKIWIPLLKSKLGDNYRRASASFIWAIISRMYAARQAGLKQEMFGVVDGGYLEIIRRFQALLEKRGVVLETGTRVVRVDGRSDGPRVLREGGNSTQFDAVAMTVPTDLVARLVPGLGSREKKRLENVTYLGVICVSLLLKKPLKGYYVTNITESWVPFTTVIEMTSLADPGRFGGNSLVYLPVYLPQDHPYWNCGDSHIIEVFMNAFFSMYPHLEASDIAGTSVARERHVLPLTVRNYSDRCMPPMKTSVDRVFCVNSAQIANGTMNINEITGLAKAASRNLADLLGGGNG